MEWFGSKIDGANLWCVSDIHWSHKNLVRGVSTWDDKSGCRDFDTVEEMNETIINSILETVPSDGILVNCGDMLFGNKDYLPTLVERLKPRKHLYILGNHCDFIRKRPEYRALFDYCGDYLELMVRKQNGGYRQCIFAHYPMKVWNHCQRRGFIISGHSHLSLPYTENERGIDVCWDLKRRPVHFFEIEEMLANREFKPKDHHR